MVRAREKIRNRGTVLIAVLVIAAAMSVAFVPIATLALGAVKAVGMSAASQRALFAAEAGVYRAVREYKVNVNAAKPYWRTRTETLATDLKYTVGVNADFLLIRTNDEIVKIDGGDLHFSIPFMQNMNDINSISIAAVQLFWHSDSDSGFNNATLVDVNLAGSDRYPGSCASGTKISFGPAIAFSPMVMYPCENDNGFAIDYGSIPPDMVLYVIYYFSDNSTRRVLLTTALYNCEFQITSTGEVTGLISAKRTIRATYDVTSRQITSWQEIPSNLL